MNTVRLLMELQYGFPLTLEPYRDLAERLGVETSKLVEEVRRLIEEGIVKRVGFHFNVRSVGVKPVLIGVRADAEEAVERLGMVEGVTHAYLRDHPRLNLWVVARVRSLEEAADLAKSLSVDGTTWTLFPSTRTLKLSVKYDLYEGVSKAGPYSRVRENPPPPESFGIPRGVARRLARLPVVCRPYRGLAREVGLAEEELLGRVRAMLEAGTLLDPGAALDGWRLGFRSNAMTVTEASEQVCNCIASSPYTTHVVERTVYHAEPGSEWRERMCFFMVHGVSRQKTLAAVKTILTSCGVEPIAVLFSQEDLLPGRVR